MAANAGRERKRGREIMYVFLGFARFNADHELLIIFYPVSLLALREKNERGCNFLRSIAMIILSIMYVSAL